MSSLSSLRNFGPKEIHNGAQAVPATLTEVTAKNGGIYQIVISNPTGGALTLLLQDQQNTPAVIVPTISIAAGSVSVISFGEGISCPGGIKWQGSGTGMWAEIYGNTHT